MAPRASPQYAGPAFDQEGNKLHVGARQETRMNIELIGLTREHAMRLAADLTISGSAEHVVELLRQAQWSALSALLGPSEAHRLVSATHAAA